MSLFGFHLMNVDDAETILSWSYPPPYDVYNSGPGQSEDDIRYMLRPELAFHAAFLRNQLAGFCSSLPVMAESRVDPLTTTPSMWAGA